MNDKYLKFVNMSTVDAIENISDFIVLLFIDKRVRYFSVVDNEKITIEADEIEKGTYTIGSIANNLYETNSERRARLEVKNKVLEPVINIKSFSGSKIANGTMSQLYRMTYNKMITLSFSLEAGSARAQCLNIANYYIEDETIADRLKRDHRSQDGAQRAGLLMVEAGAANQENHTSWTFGKITFQDGSFV